jgi:hypothetical protein
VSFAFLVAGFLATTNAGRVALARATAGPSTRERLVAVGVGATVIVLAAAFADDLLDALDISPESFRIAAGIVLAATGIRELIWPHIPGDAPFAAVLLTPELVCVALSFGADESLGRTLAAGAIGLSFAAVAALADRVRPGPLPARLLAALQIVVAVALGVSGVRDV